jgi:hypothetical protein
VRPSDEDQPGSRRPKLMSSSRRHSGEINILAMLEGRSGQSLAQRIPALSAALWYGSAGLLACALVVALAWLARDADTPGRHGAGAPIVAPTPQDAPAHDAVSTTDLARHAAADGIMAAQTMQAQPAPALSLTDDAAAPGTGKPSSARAAGVHAPPPANRMAVQARPRRTAAAAKPTPTPPSPRPGRRPDHGHHPARGPSGRNRPAARRRQRRRRPRAIRQAGSWRRVLRRQELRAVTDGPSVSPWPPRWLARQAQPKKPRPPACRGKMLGRCVPHRYTVHRYSWRWFGDDQGSGKRVLLPG